MAVVKSMSHLAKVTLASEGAQLKTWRGTQIVVRVTRNHNRHEL